MSTHDPQNQLAYLLDEIKELGGARHLSYVIQDATGLFVPGFSALPAVTIIGTESWKTRARSDAESWRTGDLIALTLDGDADSNPDLQHVFFSPICDVTIPLVDVSPTEEASRFARSFRLTPNDRWQELTIQFAFLPWDADDGADFEWTSEDIALIGETLEKARLQLSVIAEAGGQSIRLQPAWGPTPSLAESITDGARFPLNHARELVAPFLFRLSFTPTLISDTGEAISIERQPIALRFEFPEEALSRLFSDTGFGLPRRPGISIFANAIPMANLDLKAWPAGDTFADFVREAGMKPLGVAGICRFKRVGEGAVTDPLQSHANVFSVEIDRNNMMLNRYGLPGEEDSMKDKQLLLWMTLGSQANKARFTYKPQQIRQPMEKSSEMLVNARTVLPCFGGTECFPSDRNDVHRSLMLNVAAVPQMFTFRNGLTHAVQDVIARLGYDRVTVESVEPELRVVNGMRRRVIVVHLDNRGRHPVDPKHVRALCNYLIDCSPIGTEVCVEETPHGV